jgi:DNA-binding Lrp family transcriptional regulator
MNLNRTDLLVVSCLRKDARMKLTEMSKLTRVPVSTLFDRIRSMEGRTLLKHTAILRFEAIGFPVKAMVVLAAKRGDREILAGILKSHPNVNSIFRINNGWHFLVEAVFPGVREAEDFVSGIEAKVRLKDRSVHFVVEDLAREKLLSCPEDFLKRGGGR